MPSAIHEMIGTWRDAELLKQEAGIRRGGRALERPVKHVSLNWHPGEKPDRARMIAAAEEYLVHMGWQEHQAVLVCHTDKAHAHVHIMLNAVHPETGRKLDDGLEKRRSQQWALAHEQAQGRIYCPQRLVPPPKREPSPSRPTWLAMKGAEPKPLRVRVPRSDAAPGRAAIATRMPAVNRDRRILKDRQCRTVYREVREAFRPQWARYYAACRAGADGKLLRPVKADLIARQTAMLRERREAAYAGFGGIHDIASTLHPTTQREARATPTMRQVAGEVTRRGAGFYAPCIAVPILSRTGTRNHRNREMRTAAVQITGRMAIAGQRSLMQTGPRRLDVQTIHVPSPPRYRATTETGAWKGSAPIGGWLHNVVHQPSASVIRTGRAPSAQRSAYALGRRLTYSGGSPLTRQRVADILHRFGVRLAALGVTLPPEQRYAARFALWLEEAHTLAAERALVAAERVAALVTMRQSPSSDIAPANGTTRHAVLLSRGQCWRDVVRLER